MGKTRKRLLWLGGVCGGLPVLLIACALLAPKFIDLNSLKDKVSSEIERTMGEKAGLGGISVSIFPRPRVELRGITIAQPKGLVGNIERVTVYPRILPLLIGRIEIGSIEVEAPQFTVPFPAMPRWKAREGDLSMLEIEKDIVSFLSRIRSGVESLSVRVKEGGVSLVAENGKTFGFGGIEAHLSVTPGGFWAGLKGAKCGLWESLAVSMNFEPVTFAGEGRVQLTGFNPQILTDYIFPSGDHRLGESRVSLDLNFSANGPNVMRADFKVFIPGLTIEREDETLPVAVETMEGALSYDSGRLSFNLSKLESNFPRLTATGSVVLDPGVPAVRVEFNAADADVGSLRKVALALLGSKRGVRNTFRVLRGGEVPIITVSAQGSSLSDLERLENYIIKGDLVNGVVYVPTVKLQVENVSGHALISNAVLEGRDMVGTTVGESIGRDGYLKLCLESCKEGYDPFKLDIELDADLAKLPAILDLAVHNKDFLRELALVKDVKGRAHGRLTMGDDLNDVNTRVEIKEFNLYGRFERIPYAVDVRGGPFIYEGTMVSGNALSGRIGNSRFSNLAASVDWGPESHIKVSTSDSIEFSLEEMHSWLTRYSRIREALEDFESFRGLLKVSHLDLTGPLFEPREWKFAVKGAVQDLLTKSTLLPALLAVKSGLLEADQNDCVLMDWLSNLLDSTVVVNGRVSGYLSRVYQADLTFSGIVPPQANEWVSELSDIPRELKLRPPVSLAKVHLVWRRDGPTDFSGDLSVQDGPKVTLDMTRSPSELSIRRLSISDADSNVSLNIGFKNGEFDLVFAGELGNTTVDRLLQTNEFVRGVIKGDFRAHILFDQPMNSVAQGQLQASGFTYLWKGVGPIEIENATVEAAGNRFAVKTASLGWRGRHIILGGNVDFTEAGYLLDMDLSADGSNWEDLRRIIERNKHLGPQDESAWRLPLRGTLRVNADYFTYGDYTWRPVKAAISFNADEEVVDVAEATLCTISTPMKITLPAKTVLLDAKPKAEKQQIDPTLICLWDKAGLVVGSYDLDGKVTVNGNAEEVMEEGLVKLFRGDLEFNSKAGRIQRWTLMSKIFSLLNVTEIYRGSLPDLTTEGFPYDSIKIKGHLSDGKFVIDQFIIDGPSMKMVFSGDIYLLDETVDFTVLVAPLKTVDRIIEHIPFVGYVLGGTLVSIPVKVTGNIADPTVVPLSPAAVGSELVGYMERVFKLPFKVIQPLMKQ